MEAFRTCEKETKIKAYSKEGLHLRSIKEEGKESVRRWITGCLDQLQSQIDSFDVELESLSDQPDSEDFARRCELELWVERNKYHCHALEFILRHYDNERISDDQIDQIRDILGEYIENRAVCVSPFLFLFFSFCLFVSHNITHSK